MADQTLSAPFTGTISSTGKTKLHAETPQGIVARWVIGLQSSSFSGSITVKARPLGSSQTFVAVAYLGLYVNGAVGSGGYSGAAITDSSLIVVDATGMEVELDCTVASGSMAVAATPAAG